VPTNRSYVAGERRDLAGSDANKPCPLVSREGVGHIGHTVFRAIVGAVTDSVAIGGAAHWSAASAKVVPNFSNRRDLKERDGDVIP